MEDIPGISNELAAIIRELKGLESLNSSYYYQLATIYVSLKNSLNNIKKIDDKAVYFTDLYLLEEEDFESQTEWIKVKYYIESFQESYILFDNIQSSTISIISRKINEVEHIVAKDQWVFIITSSLFGLLVILISVGLSLLFSNQFVNDVKQIASDLNLMIKEGTKRDIRATSTTELDTLAKNVVTIFDQLVDTQEQLARTDRITALGRLTVGIAHQINTPLGITLTTASHLESRVQSIQELLENGELTEEGLVENLSLLKKSLALIVSNTKRTGKLINSFKELASSPEKVEKKNVPIQYICDFIPSFIDSMDKDGNILFNFDYLENMTINVRLDKTLQVFRCLVENSVIHGFQDRKEGKISISFKRVENINRIVYKDNGSGIHHKNVKNIFEPFYGSSRGMNNGMGLGLSKVYNIIRDNFLGSIEYVDNNDSGVEFVIEFSENE